ncbi:MAG TPA: MBL fold metallo-hydrolase [Desulfosalsimonadaceae bacterium]|nr:MBL fold metallo-hydrolase [Desulfosalsimonadaceae bacterium]
MQLTVLLDNNTLIDRYFLGEPGVSYWIQEGDTRVLFDVGYSDAFIVNARKMDIDLLQSDYIVLSHGHLDHTWGLDPLIKLYTEAAIESIPAKRPTLIAHPDAFFTKSIEGCREIGCTIAQEKLETQFQLNLPKTPFWITEKLVFLGEIERTNAFENREALGVVHGAEGARPDFLMDDTALAYTGEDGLVIITGCSHSGICNIIEYARKICRRDKVADVIGGFHLLQPSQTQLDHTLTYFANLQPQQLHACHCVDLDSKIALSRAANLKEVGVGLSVQYK